MRILQFTCCCLTFLLLACLVSTTPTPDVEASDDDEVVIQKWKNTFARVKKFVDAGIKAAMPHFMDRMASEDLHISQKCRRGLFMWIADLKAMKPWAMRMFDASAKVIDGILTGTLSSFGSFDQCLNVENAKGTIQGQYCTVEGWPKLPKKPRFYALNKRLPLFKRFENDTGMMGEFTKSVQLFYMFPLRLGICIPSMCSIEDLRNITSIVTKNLLPLNLTVPRCQVKEPVVIENYQIPIFVVIAVLTLCVIVGTLYDLIVFKKKNMDGSEGIFVDCLLAFSVFKNWNKLMDLEAGSDDLSVLHGIRFFTMCWIILGHTYLHLNFNILRHLQITIEMTSQFIFNSVTNATLVVDNFFFMSGLLLIYVTMDMVKAIGKIPRAIYFILHRLWRFLPIQMFFVGLSTMLPLLGSGPAWHENIDPIVEGCQQDWWINMIFINNLYRTRHEGCLSYSWYLSADFQIYIFSIPIIILIIKRPRLGLWVNSVVMILSIVAVAVHNYVRELPPTLLFTRADIEQRTALIKETYYNPYQHLGPYCIGVFVGYFLQVRKSPLNMHWCLHLFLWLSTFTLMCASLFGVHPWNIGYGSTGVIASMFYACLSRISWTLALAWITVACSTGCGGLIAWILRSKIYIPFSRLTFLVYMVHPLVQFVFYGTLREGIQAQNHLAVFICFGYIISSYGIALILSMLLESPFISLGKIIFRRRESFKKRQKIKQSLRNEEMAKDVPDSRKGWKAGLKLSLMNGYGKSNGAFEAHPEKALASQSIEDLKKEEHHSGDFICHL